MKATFVRLSYVPILWAGGGFASWFCGGGVGEPGWLLGMFSGADLYWSLQDRPRRFWLMFVLAMLGIPCGLTYEYLVVAGPPWPMGLRVVVFGIAIGSLFGFVSSGIGWLFGVQGSPDTGGTSGTSSGGET